VSPVVVQVPVEALSVWPTTAAPVIVGGLVFTGALGTAAADKTDFAKTAAKTIAQQIKK
jgi:hypothetical protein